MTNEHSTSTEGPARGRWSQLQELPWWAGVLLTVADTLNRPWLPTTIWVALIVVRIGWRTGRHWAAGARSRRSARDPLPNPDRGLPEGPLA